MTEAGSERPGRAALLAGMGLLAGAAASTLATAVAATVAGHDADLSLAPVELSVRVGLLLAAPLVGALLAAIAVPRGGRLTAAAVGLGVPAGPLLVLQVQRLRQFGPAVSLLTVAALVIWAVVGGLLAAGWWARAARRVETTALPHRPPPPEPAAGPGDGPPAPEPRHDGA
jgi:hypothetical protein